MQLSLAETLALLVLAQEATDPERSVPFQEAARDASMKLQSSVPTHLTNYVNKLMSSLSIQTEPLAQFRAGRQHYDCLVEALSLRRKVRVNYQSFAEGTQIQTLISPYHMLFRRHAWYVIGRSSLHRSVRTFHIGRVLEAQMTPETFQVPPRFSLKRYFGNAWNLIREREYKTLVVVRFKPLVAGNVAEVAWHPSQKCVWNEDGTMNFSVEVDGTNEISWWILSYGNQAEVLQPESLRQLILDRAREMVAQYL